MVVVIDMLIQSVSNVFLPAFFPYYIALACVEGDILFHSKLRFCLGDDACDPVEQLVVGVRSTNCVPHLSKKCYFAAGKLRCSVLRTLADVVIQPCHTQLVQDIIARYTGVDFIFTPAMLVDLCKDLMKMRMYLDRQNMYFRGIQKQQQIRFAYVCLSILGYMLNRLEVVHEMYKIVPKLTVRVAEVASQSIPPSCVF